MPEPSKDSASRETFLATTKDGERVEFPFGYCALRDCQNFKTNDYGCSKPSGCPYKNKHKGLPYEVSKL